MSYNELFSIWAAENMDPPDYRELSSGWVGRARKEHICAHCKKPIAVDTPYFRHAFIEEGEFCFERSHSSNGACLQ